MTTIRPDFLPPGGQGPKPQDNGKLAAQRQFFAALAQAQGPTAVAPAVTVKPIAAPAETNAAPAGAASTNAPQKILRPGSLIDIRV